MGFNIKKFSFALILALPLLCPAESVWVRYGWQAFANAADARLIALGGQHATGNFDLARLGNPALTAVAAGHLTYAHQSRFAGIVTSDLLGFTLKPETQLPLGVVLLYEGVERVPDTRGLLLDWGADGQPGTGDAGENNGVLDEGERLDEERLRHFRQRQLAVHISSARRRGPYLIGLALKGLNHTLAEFSGNGIGFDIGINRSLGSNGEIGLTIHDFTSSWLVWDSGTIERTAPSLRLGGRQTMFSSRIPVALTIVGDLLQANRQAGAGTPFTKSGTIGLSCGMELIYKDKFHLRFGRDQLEIMTAGIGVRWDRIGIDYAYRLEPANSGLGPGHYLSFELDPTWIRAFLTVFEPAG
ncbi:MAG: hypothetical protein ABIA75_00655 [Candidatus Neomarinimicrobiota bacterium]